MLFISNYFWWDNDSEYDIKLIENNNIFKPIKRSSSYDSFFTEEKNNKQDKLDYITKVSILSNQIDNIDKKFNFYIDKINNYNQSNYKMLIGFGGIILFSMITLNFIKK